MERMAATGTLVSRATSLVPNCCNSGSPRRGPRPARAAGDPLRRFAAGLGLCRSPLAAQAALQGLHQVDHIAASRGARRLGLEVGNLLATLDLLLDGGLDALAEF